MYLYNITYQMKFVGTFVEIIDLAAYTAASIIHYTQVSVQKNGDYHLLFLNITDGNNKTNIEADMKFK